jgi:hypothetical protein
VKNKLLYLLICVSYCIMIMSTGVYAGTYEATGTRGVKNLCCTKSVILWKTNSKKITKYDTRQSSTGFFVSGEGIKKVSILSSDTSFVFDCKTKFLAGAIISGITIGYSKMFTDRCTVTRNGKAKWKKDI